MLNAGVDATAIWGKNIRSSPGTISEVAIASELFDQFVSAGTFKSVLSTYRQLCEVLRLKPTNISSFYPQLKSKIRSWRATSLWAKLDKRAAHKWYDYGKACPNARVLLIGAGPCGLRAAIEAQLLGAKVVVIEKRDRFSRNNVLHLWPFVIHDLRNLGAKKFFGKFCPGSIDHISIRQLQLILLKVALLLGVEVHENVGFVKLLEPPEDQEKERIGWRACVDPIDHPVSQYEFDVLIGADGKRNTLPGFNRKELRAKLAIAITANFINKHTLEEARVPEISGVASIFNQKFFQDMKEQTGIDLENIAYYKDDTHYFVMTAKKQSLLARGVIINDYNDTAKLLSAENVDREALMEYARDAADFATDYQLPNCDFAVNHYRQADVAMFDFTSMYAAENASRVTERKDHKLLQGLVGDSLLEPFWPTGSGCARGFLSSFDVAWMIRSWCSGKLTQLQVLAEREAIYRLLAQTTPENLSKDFNQYTINPTSRYPNLNLHSVLPSQVRMLYDTDGKIDDQIIDTPAEIPRKKRRKESGIHPETLLNWCQRQVAVHESIKIENLTSSWKNGLALCAILHRYRPDLIDIKSLKPDDAAKNNQLAFDICEKELGIPPITTGQEMADCEVPDKLSMVSYLAQIYEAFRGEIPVVYHSKSSSDDKAVSPQKQSFGSRLSLLTKFTNKLQNKRKYSIEKESTNQKFDGLKKTRHPPLTHKRKLKDRDRSLVSDFINKDVELTNFKFETTQSGTKDSIDSRVKNLELKMKQDAGLKCPFTDDTNISKNSQFKQIERKELNIKLIQEQLKKSGNEPKEKKHNILPVGRLRKDDWNIKMLEEKINLQQKSLQKIAETEKPKIQQDIFDNKLRLIEAKLQSGGALTPEEEARFKKFDSSLNKLADYLTKGNLDVGERGHNQVAAMAEHMSTIWDKKISRKKDPLPPAPILNVPVIEPRIQIGGSEICYFCKKRVYLMERLSAEGLFFHRSCFKCEYCGASLRLGNYSFDKNIVCGGKFYCRLHFRMQKPDPRSQEMMKRKEAFLSCTFDEQKEKIYKSVLASAEKALSPNKTILNEDLKPELTVVDSSVSDIPGEISDERNICENKNDSKLLNVLLESQNNLARDKTPERVEYENIILEYSEEELLTTELEEEELTQKNLGPYHELTTSDDEYSEFSTDSASDEEAYAEELERSLTADETRKLAEQWQKKYSGERSLASSCASSSTDEVSSTEIGSEDGTTDDINSDEEYSIGERKHTGHTNQQYKKNETQDHKSDLMVKVPVINLKCLQNSSEGESTSVESDSSEEASDSKKSSENEVAESETGTESESESEPQLPLQQIPTIVIEESPPQDNDQDQEWSDDVPIKSIDKNQLSNNHKKFSENHSNCSVSKDIVQKSQTIAQSLPEKHLENDDNFIIDISNANACDKTSLAELHCSDTFHNKAKNQDVTEDESFSTCVQKLETTDLTAKSNANIVITEVVKDNISKCATNEQIFTEFDVRHCENVTDETEIFVPVSNDASFHIPPSLSSLNMDNAQNECIELSPCTCNSSSVSSGGWELLKSEQPSESSDCPLIDPEISPSVPEKTKLSNNDSNLISLIKINETSELAHSNSVSMTPEISSTYESVNDKVKDIYKESNDSLTINVVNSDASNNFPSKLSSGIVSNNLNDHDSKNDSYHLSESDVSLCLENDKEFNHYNPSFVTTRLKNKSSIGYEWDSDKDLSMPCNHDLEIFNSFDFETEKLNENKNKPLNNLEKNDNIIIDFNEKSSEPYYSTNPVFVSTSEHLKNTSLNNFSPTNNNSRHEEIEKANILVDFENDNKLYNTDVTPESFNKNYSSEIEATKNSSTKITPLVQINANNKSPLSQTYSSHDNSLDGISNKDSKFRGYSGSFAEKIRPKSALGDTIYLRSLDINLQKQQFPSSLTKSNDKLDDVNCDVEQNIRRKLFYSVEKLQSHDNDSTSESCKKVFKRQTSTPIQKSSDFSNNVMSLSTDVVNFISNNVNKTGQLNIFLEKPDVFDNISEVHYESFGDPISPYTYSQVKVANENIFPVNMRPTSIVNVANLQVKRNKRKSVHENIQGLPFADEEKAVTPIDTPTSPGIAELDNEFENFFDTDNMSENFSAHEKARKEARARAKLKTDEELGLSPKNYRKKYQRQLSLSSIYYDELVRDEFDEDENEVIDDDLIESTLYAKNIDTEKPAEGSDNEKQYLYKVEEKSTPTLLSKDLKNQFVISCINDNKLLKTDNEQPNMSIVKQIDSVTSTSSSKNFDCVGHAASSMDLKISETQVQKNTETIKGKPKEHENLVLSNLKNKQWLSPLTSVSSTKLGIENNSNDVSNYHIKSKSSPPENFSDSEKLKSIGKKSFFSKLNFAKSHASKDKANKNKSKEFETIGNSSSTEFSEKTSPKQKSFPNLKNTKIKEKKQKQTHSSETTSDALTKNRDSSKSNLEQFSTRPKTILLDSEQAKIMPTYTVYKYPGTRLTSIPSYIPTQKSNSGVAPKASEDSFSDTEDDTNKQKTNNVEVDLEKEDKELSEKTKKAQKLIQKVQRQQELKRIRNGQEIQRRLEELEVQQKELEQQGVEVEKALRLENQNCHHGGESDLMQTWYELIESKNRLRREEQELLIRIKDLELEERHSRLDQEFRERMAQNSSQKNLSQIGEEKKILTEMLLIVEERDKLVAALDHLLKEKDEDKTVALKTSNLPDVLSTKKS